jgi:hypothetical protein
LEGVQKLVATIDSENDIDIDSVAEMISRLTERLDRMEAQQSESIINLDVDRFACAVSNIDERLEKVEDDINSIALTIQDLRTKMSNLEAVGDIGSAATPLSKLEQPADITADVESIAEPASSPQPPTPLTQSALARRLRCSDKAIEKHRRQDSKENFAVWSRDRDPEGLSWTWEGAGGRGQPLRFVPLAN